MNISFSSLYSNNLKTSLPFKSEEKFGLCMKPQLTCDTVSFKGFNPSVFDRKEGAAYSYFDYQKGKEICENVPVFKECNTFGVNEYKNISDNERRYLDGLLDEVYCKRKPYYFSNEEISRTVNDDADFLIKVTETVKNSLNEKYPEGYKLIGLGGSPAIFNKILEYQGIDSKIVPFRHSVAGDDFDYKSYFKIMGLDETYLKNSPEKIVFLDYKKTGATFDKLKSTLEKNNLVDKENTDYVSFMELLYRKTDLKSYNTLQDFYFENRNIKSYSPAPEMDSKECWANAERIKDDFNWSVSTKLINYAILKKLDESGKLFAKTAA